MKSRSKSNRKQTNRGKKSEKFSSSVGGPASSTKKSATISRAPKWSHRSHSRSSSKSHALTWAFPEAEAPVIVPGSIDIQEETDCYSAIWWRIIIIVIVLVVVGVGLWAWAKAIPNDENQDDGTTTTEFPIIST